LLCGGLEAVVEVVVEIAVFAALFEIVKVIPEIVILFIPIHGVFIPWEAGA
jgi:hypothetical protein